ncbi:MAG: hypothetical protein CVU56_20745, partial [Deltaproteobacteria bacterium HGW-Deltaproteobacteria-14]
MDREEQAERRLTAILATTDTRDGKLWAILQLLEDAIALPAAARVAGGRVEVTHVDYGGDEVQGLIAAVSDDSGTRSLPLAEVAFLTREPGAGVVRAYADWVRGPAADPGARAATAVRPTDGPIDLAVLAVLPRTARCRRLDDGSDVVYRPSDREQLVPGTIITVTPRHRDGRLEGPITATSVDPARLGLVPPALEPVDAAVTTYALATPPAPDQLEEAALLADAGDPREARRLLLALLAEEPLLLDVHAALGDLALASLAATALAHYAVGAALGDASVPDPCDGLVPWEQASNRGYLACLYGCARALHRLGRDVDARRPLERLLALDPDDHLGASQL